MIIDSYSAMIELGNRVGSLLKPGDVILLKGELGAGKTALTRGIGARWGSMKSLLRHLLFQKFIRVQSHWYMWMPTD